MEEFEVLRVRNDYIEIRHRYSRQIWSGDIGRDARGRRTLGAVNSMEWDDTWHAELADEVLAFARQYALEAGKIDP